MFQYCSVWRSGPSWVSAQTSLFTLGKFSTTISSTTHSSVISIPQIPVIHRFLLLLLCIKYFQFYLFNKSSLILCLLNWWCHVPSLQNHWFSFGAPDAESYICILNPLLLNEFFNLLCQSFFDFIESLNNLHISADMERIVALKNNLESSDALEDIIHYLMHSFFIHLWCSLILSFVHYPGALWVQWAKLWVADGPSSILVFLFLVSG